MDNSTTPNIPQSYGGNLPPLPNYSLSLLPPLLSPIPDAYLALALPIIAYWGVSLIFHLIDTYDLFPSYRLHTPAEVLKRNHVSRWEVFRDVLIQQIVQTAVGLVLSWSEEDAVVGKEDFDIAVWAQRLRVAQRAIPTALAVLGLDAQRLAKNMVVSAPSVAGVLMGGSYPWLTQTYVQNGVEMDAPAFAQWELLAAKGIYWVGIPALQFLCAILFVDTWQYFWHRTMHMNKWLYSKDPQALGKYLNNLNSSLPSNLPLSASPSVRSLCLRRSLQSPIRRLPSRYAWRWARLPCHMHVNSAVDVVLHPQHHQNRRRPLWLRASF